MNDQGGALPPQHIPDPAPIGPAPLPPSRRGLPDAGSPKARTIAWVVMLLSLACVVLLNQVVKPVEKAATQTTLAIDEPPTPPGPGDQFALSGRIITKLGNVMPRPTDPAALASHQSQMGSLTTQVTGAARTPIDQFRAAVVVAELRGAGAARMQLPPTTDHGLNLDEARLSTIWDNGPSALSQEDRDALIARHGWFGRLALVYNLPDTDPQRSAIVGGGTAIFAFFIIVGIGAVVLLLAAIAAAIIALVALSNGKVRWRFVPPSPGGSTSLEMVALLVGAFLFYKLVAELAGYLLSSPSASPPEWAGMALLAAQWLLVIVIFWPRFRGVPKAQAWRDLGWHKGEGVMKEIAAGLFAYLATLPILIFAAIITLIIFLLRGVLSGGNAQPPSNPIIEIVAGGSWLQILLLYTLATIWAPLVEETVFRGALYRHFRSRVGIILAAVPSAIIFGVMHGYPFLMLLPVISLGFNFALMREWRDSIIGPVVAHCLHNAVVLAVVITLLNVLGA